MRSPILAQPEFKNHTIAELNQAMIDMNRAKLRMDAEALDSSLPTIVVGHAHLFGARIGAERLLTMGNDPMYDMQTFDLPGVPLRLSRKTSANPYKDRKTRQR